jgi:hypothetical protein
MILNETVIEGTLKPDGTLELDQKPDLPPGRVKVVLRQEAASQPPLEDWWQFMRRSRHELEASGARFMNESDVNAHIEWLREGDPIDELLQRPEPLS